MPPPTPETPSKSPPSTPGFSTSLRATLSNPSPPPLRLSSSPFSSSPSLSFSVGSLTSTSSLTLPPTRSSPSYFNVEPPNGDELDADNNGDLEWMLAMEVDSLFQSSARTPSFLCLTSRLTRWSRRSSSPTSTALTALAYHWLEQVRQSQDARRW
ncbi:hypothetical protein ACFX2I_028334 [Malus domestica]